MDWVINRLSPEFIEDLRDSFRKEMSFKAPEQLVTIEMTKGRFEALIEAASVGLNILDPMRDDPRNA